MKFGCPFCNSKFTRKRNLNRHFSEKHSGQKIVSSCFLCGQVFKNDKKLQKHRKTFHRPSKKFELRETAFQKAAVSYRYLYDSRKILTPSEAQNSILTNEIKKIIYFEAGNKNALKFCCVFIAEMVMHDNANNIVASASIPFRSQTFTATSLDKHKIKKNISKAMLEQSNKIEDFINNGSNWVFNRAIAMDIEIGAMNPVFVGANTSHLKVDIENIPNKKHLMNIPSRNNKCFLYCLAEALFGSEIKNKNSCSQFEKFFKFFNFEGIKFPVTVNEIKKFVKKNSQLDIKINIMFWSEQKIYPLECGIGSGSRTVNLLSVPIEKKSVTMYHFLLIKNLDKFLSKIYKAENRCNYYEKAFYCPNCFNKFSQKFSRDNHMKNCFSQKSRIEEVPNKENNKIFFNKYENQFPQNLIAYLDFECELSKINDLCRKCSTLRCKCDVSYTRFETEQKPICFSFVIVDRDNKIMYTKTFSGENAADIFLDDLLSREKHICNYLNEIVPMEKLSKEEENIFKLSTNCYICNNLFTIDDPKVRDHNHENGAFIAAAHNSCNLRRRRQKTLKIFMHNGSKYDFHFLVKSLAKRNLTNMYILPYNMENFRMIKFNSFMLVDSLAFLQSSLSQLSDELKASNHEYPIIRQSSIVKTAGKFDEEKFNMVLQKGFFPYEYW